MSEREQADPALAIHLQNLSHYLADGEVSGYLAVNDAGNERAFAVVALPRGIRTGPSASEQIAAALESHAAHARELEAMLAERIAFCDELEAERNQAVARVDGLIARAEELSAEVKEWRQRASIAEGGLMRLLLSDPEAAARYRAEREEEAAREAELANRDARVIALEAELAIANQTIERAARSWRETEAKSDAAWRRVGQIQAELDQHREQTVQRAAEQRRSAQLSMTKAMEDAALKLVGVREQLRRCEERCRELEAKLAASEQLPPYKNSI